MKFVLRTTALSALIVLFFCADARASSFSFTISGGYTASGILTTNPPSSGTYTITGISGSQGGSAISLIAPNGFADNDNLLFAGSPFLDGSGLSFVVGTTDYNVYYDGAPYGGSATSYYETAVSGALGTLVTFGVTPVPEPSTLAYLILLLTSMAIAARYKWRAAR